jgi:arsenate reductase
MKTHHREILIYYNPESNKDRRTVAHAMGLAKHIKPYSFHSAPSTGMSWSMIISALNVHPKELLDKSKAYYQEHIRGREFDEEGWLNIIRRNPDLIKAPIAVRGTRAVLCIQPTEIYKLTEQKVPDLDEDA